MQVHARERFDETKETQHAPGGATRARPETCRLLFRSRQAVACFPQGVLPPCPGCPGARPEQAAGDAFGAGSGTNPDRPPRSTLRWDALPAMSATGPFRSDPAAPSFARTATGKPARWLAWPFGRTALALGSPPKPDAASGTAMAAASPRPPPHVRALDRGHSLPPGSKRSRSIRQRKHGDYGMGVRGCGKSGGGGSGGRRPEINEIDFCERRPEREAARRLYDTTGICFVILGVEPAHRWVISLRLSTCDRLLPA